MTPKTKLSCRNVWKLYGANAEAFLKDNPSPSGEEIRSAGIIGAVRNASIDIAEGEIFIIMGLSGSGKSTLVRCLSRLIEPTGGEVLFDGVDLLTASERELIQIRRHKMGMVFQHFALLPHLTVLQNVMFPLTVQGAPKAEAEAKARDVVELVGLKGREDYYPRELSGGQQQRVGIARSLVTEPDLWFLDEPFSALDPLIRREMQDEFLRLQARLHKTIVFITHDFEEAVRLADRIAIMKDGEIIQVATPEELVLNPATGYVAEFTRHIPRSKVLTVAGLMTPGAGCSGEPVLQSARISEVAERIISAEDALPVADEAGQIVGSIDRTAIAHVLFGAGDAA
ncbi:quaternary amine ABC transporter ATP-binding protein [Leisingera methylohalidivorans]|uniref:Quaternary amine transport ATP-binding protein n=1 Tax=Leisingera methylohalidivorans DSM 14336 TaxID=999552 RepID=V9VZF1_9RHOB|nr:betaine/proline/choline family ABC transporter ATP-binding protein [Leisingera methylohalidivorans]AHD02252.1 ABC transporter ATP-binding protein [Leisingera methylohalidivorans DSM 14336]